MLAAVGLVGTSSWHYCSAAARAGGTSKGPVCLQTGWGSLFGCASAVWLGAPVSVPSCGCASVSALNMCKRATRK